MTWAATVLTLFPEMFPGPLGGSLAGKALKAGLWGLEVVDIRDFSRHKHRAVDDTPSGGGAGMVMKPDVLAAAIDAQVLNDRRLIYLSPRGRRFDQAQAKRLKDDPGVVLICGRFEGIDERVIEAREIDEVSLGDFVLMGGEVAAMALLEATVRLLDNVVGDQTSLIHESFADDLLEHPHYTRPRIWEDREIPEVLLSGDHKRIDDWRRAKSEDLTRERRPDLWTQYEKKKGRDPS